MKKKRQFDGKSDKSLNRRKFLDLAGKTAIAGSLGFSLSSCEKEKVSDKNVNINFNKSFYWKMLTTWPPNFPILGESCSLFADWVNKMSGGRMEIRVFGGGEIVPALEVFDAVSNGIAEIGNGSPYYWSGKIPAAQIFASVPFGMNARMFNAWIEHGGGIELWRELYRPFNLKPFLSGNTGVQMGGWFNKEIKEISDIEGLKMRIPGLGGEVFKESGGTSVLVAGGEIFTNLERGVIDATEWIGPFHDYLMGFHKIAKYYYYPGWHETGTSFETFINESKLKELPEDLQSIIEYGVQMMNNWVLSAFDDKNAQYLKKIKEESDVIIKEFPKEVLSEFRQNKDRVLERLSSENEDFMKIYKKYSEYYGKQGNWTDISEKAYFQNLNINE